MVEFVPALVRLLLKVGIVAFLANEVRGIVLAGPVLYAMYEAGGTWMAMWLGFCALCGIAISVLAPMWVARKLKLLPVRLA
jgi:hypothetical protein